MNELRKTQAQLKIKGPEMAQRFGLEYESYRYMYYDRVKIPDHLKTLLIAARKHDEMATRYAVQAATTMFNNDFPNGIQSIPEADE